MVNIDNTSVVAAGGQVTFQITKEDTRPWVVTVPADSWYQVNTESGTVSAYLYKLVIDFDENTGASDRSFSFTAGSDLETDLFTITQYGTGNTLSAEIIAATSGNILAAGGQVTVDVQSAGGDDSLSTASSNQSWCILSSTTHGVTSGGVTCTRFVFTCAANTGTGSRSVTLTFTVDDGNGSTATATLSRTQNGVNVQTGSLSVANASAAASATSASAVVTAVDMQTATIQVTPATWNFVSSASVQVVNGVLSLVLAFPANTGSSRTDTVQITGTDNWGNTLTASMTLTQGASGATHEIDAVWDNGGSLGYEGGSETATVAYTGTFTGDASVTAGTLPDGVTVAMTSPTQLEVTYSGGNVHETVYIPITISRTGDDNVVYSVDLVFTLLASGVFPIWEDIFGSIVSDEDWEDYELDENGTLFYSGRAFAYPDESDIRVNVSRVVAPYLVSYYKDVEFRSGGALLGSFTFVRDYSYDREMDYTQDQWLNRPVNGRVPSGVKLSVSKWGAAAGGSVQVTDEGGSLVVNEVMAKGLNTGGWISGSEGKTYSFGDEEYTVVDVCQGALLKYVNAYGAVDYLLVEGVCKKTDKIERLSYEKDAAALSTDFEGKDYQAAMTAEWTGVTGWLTDGQSLRMKHLVESVEVYMVDLLTGDETPVQMTDGNLQYKTWRSNGKKLVNYTLAWKESQKKLRR